jgi:YesN/AraC family two-component response regulator
MENIQVLFVDDEENNLLAFKASFRRQFEIFTATSAAEGLEILQRHQIPVIITDYRMPEVNGVDFLIVVKNLYPESIRVVLTGYSDIQAVIRSINEGGVSFYLFKPWKDNEIEESIKQAHEIYISNKNKEIQINSLSDEIEVLKKKIHYDYEHYTIFLNSSLSTAIKQYLVYFKDFVFHSKGKNIHFEIRTVLNGIEVELSKKDSKIETQSFLNEYIGFLRNQDAIIDPIMTDGTPFQKELLITRLNSEVRHLQTSLEIEKVRVTILTDSLEKFYDLIKNPNRNTINLNMNSSSLAETENHETKRDKSQFSNNRNENNPWVAGSFYLFAIFVVFCVLLVILKTISVRVFPILVVSSLIIFMLIGLFQLRNDETLSDKTFTELIKLTFRQIPLIRKKRNKKEDR